MSYKNEAYFKYLSVGIQSSNSKRHVSFRMKLLADQCGKGHLQCTLIVLGRRVHPLLSPTPPRTTAMSQGIHGSTGRRKLKLIVIVCLSLWCPSCLCPILSVGVSHYSDVSVHQKVRDRISKCNFRFEFSPAS